MLCAAPVPVGRESWTGRRTETAGHTLEAPASAHFPSSSQTRPPSCPCTPPVWSPVTTGDGCSGPVAAAGRPVFPAAAGCSPAEETGDGMAGRGGGASGSGVTQNEMTGGGAIGGGAAGGGSSA